MIKIENVVLPSLAQWEAVIRGMRNPMNSWEKSDSFIPCYNKTKCHECKDNQHCAYYFEDGQPYKKNEFIGSNDLDLMTRLRNAGIDHRKFMRMIIVYMDITAPLYWWKEFDTYKVGTVANSCSTMHKIAEKEFNVDDFSYEHLISDEPIPGRVYSPKSMLEATVNNLNMFRKLYLETNDKKYWWQMIQLLPSSYNQKRTVMINYEVLANMYKSRKNHKLDEWRTFCQWIETLPYSELITEVANWKIIEIMNIKK